jgi:inhibitor of KinA
MSNKAEIKPFGENAFLIEWADEISLYNHTQVTALNHVLKEEFGEFIIETTPSYQSLAIYLKKNVDTSYLIESINHLLNENSIPNETKKQKVHIPVCYDEEFGLDLEALSKFHDLSKESIITHHTNPVYPVYFIGFLPGFPYLEGLNPLIATPRKEKPRSLVSAGSVGIAGIQTGVYPMDSPGGWNIIGRSPISFFNAYKDSPSLLNSGDSVKFEAVSKAEYKEIKRAIEKNTYQLKIFSQND